MQLIRRGLQGLTLAGLMWCSVAAHAQVPTLLITVDENGGGTFSINNGPPASLPSMLFHDNGPGGLTSALTYLMPSNTVVAGDVVLLEGGSDSDLIRFNPRDFNGFGVDSLVFYSDIDDGVVAIADTGLPAAHYTNLVRLPEVGPEGDNGATYTPTAGQPGFLPTFAVTYNFKSDTSSVPEPGSIALLSGLGVTGVAFTFSRLRRRRK